MEFENKFYIRWPENKGTRVLSTETKINVGDGVWKMIPWTFYVFSPIYNPLSSIWLIDGGMDWDLIWNKHWLLSGLKL